MKTIVKGFFIAAFIILNAALVKADSTGVKSADSNYLEKKFNIKKPVGRKLVIGEQREYPKSYVDFKKEVKVGGKFYIGKPTEVSLTIISPVDIPDLKFGIEIRNGLLASGEKKKDVYKATKANVPQDVVFSVCPTSSPLIIDIGVGALIDNQTAWASSQIYQVLIDTATGLFGTEQQYNDIMAGGKENLYILSHYDCISGEWTKTEYELFINTNRVLIRKIRKLEPSVTDSEALCLHADGFKVGMPYEDESEIIKTNADEEKQFKYYLDNGWLKAFRSGKRNDWIEEFKANANKSR